MTKRAKKHQTPKPAKASLAPQDKIPLIEHVKELRRRLFYVAACVGVGSAVAYGFEHQIVDFLLRPSHGQQFIYTSPIGGMNFLFGVCLDIGLVVATPIIIYQCLAFLQPLMQAATRKFLLFASMTAGVVALSGVMFGYYVGLPSALHFLLHQFTTIQVKPLITIQSYMSFVALYLFGSALMFQLPLILFIINRIKPLKPTHLFKYERHLVVAALIIAFIMNPTPNLVDQMMVVGPIIVMYQVGIALIWFVNKQSKPSAFQQLLEADRARQAERTSRPLELFTIADVPPVPEEAPTSFELDLTPVSYTPAQATAPATPIGRAIARNPITLPRRYAPLRGQLVQ